MPKNREGHEGAVERETFWSDVRLHDGTMGQTWSAASSARPCACNSRACFYCEPYLPPIAQTVDVVYERKNIEDAPWRKCLRGEHEGMLVLNLGYHVPKEPIGTGMEQAGVVQTRVCKNCRVVYVPR